MRSRFVHVWRAASAAVAASVACVAQAQTLPSAPQPVASPPAVVLLLPTRNSLFAPAGEAVRQGFFAAHRAAGDELAIQVVELDDDPAELGRALVAARERGVKLAVGPLPRSAVNAVVESRESVLPMLILNYPDFDAVLPASTIAFGLSIEAEAQRVARVALAEFVGVRRADVRPRLAIIVGTTPLERRIAQSYTAALRSAGEVPVQIEFTPETAARVSTQLGAGSFEAVFLALNARDASQVRARIPRTAFVFATSLVNAGDPKLSPTAAALAHDLDGIRFVDMPWLLQPDHPAVAVYPKPEASLSPDLSRLYALGIDAYRIAVVWMRGDARFDFDGVTGNLRMDRSNGRRVERVPSSAIFRNGLIEREEVAR